MATEDIAISETVTENIFRKHYGTQTFIEKSAIPKKFGFKSKGANPNEDGYPDFFKDCGEFVIVVEAKPKDISLAEAETKYYMQHNAVKVPIVGIAVAGQNTNKIKASYYFCLPGQTIQQLNISNCLVSIDELKLTVEKILYGDILTDEELNVLLSGLNKKFHAFGIRDTDRSLFFSGLLIALTDTNFRNTYKLIAAPTLRDRASVQHCVVLEAHHMNKAISEAITSQLSDKINNLSKEFSWSDRFSFIKTVDIPLDSYKEILQEVEEKIYIPFKRKEKQDILGKAYKIFLKKAGKAENKNIILTPDHIKSLMVRLARLGEKDVVLDTCTGSGGFLMEAMETLINLCHGDSKAIDHVQNNQLIGFEIDPILFSLACSNMFLHGDGRTNMLFRSSLLTDSEQDQHLLNYIKSLAPNRAIINPPYENNKSIYFTLQALQYLERDGRLVIIMPTPTLTQNQENGLAAEVLKEAKLECVIKMPNNLFAEQKRTVNTSIFIFTKTAHQESDEVLFYNLEDDGFVSVQHKGRVDKNNTWEQKENEVVRAIFNKAEIPGVCEKRKIYKNGVLNCAGIQNNRKSSYLMVRLDELFDFSEGTLASESNIEGAYPFITAGEKWKTHNSYTEDTEAIVFATKAAGSLGRTHYVKGKFTVSNLCVVLTKKEQTQYPVDLEFYNCYLHSIRKRLVSDLSDGTSKLTISTDALKGYYVEYIPYDEQQIFVSEKLKKYLLLKEAFEKAQNDLKQDIEQLA